MSNLESVSSKITELLGASRICPTPIPSMNYPKIPCGIGLGGFDTIRGHLKENRKSSYDFK